MSFCTAKASDSSNEISEYAQLSKSSVSATRLIADNMLNWKRDISQKNPERLTRLSTPPASTGADCRQLCLQVLYVCADGGNLALRLRPNDCQIALGSRGCLFGRYEVNGRAQHLAQELIRPITLTLEIRPVTGGRGFDFGQLGLQQLRSWLAVCP